MGLGSHHRGPGLEWSSARTASLRAASLTFRLVDGGETTAVNLRGELPGLVAEAGFADVVESERWMTPFGTLAFVRGIAAP